MYNLKAGDVKSIEYQMEENLEMRLSKQNYFNGLVCRHYFNTSRPTKTLCVAMRSRRR